MTRITPRLGLCTLGIAALIAVAAWWHFRQPPGPGTAASSSPAPETARSSDDPPSSAELARVEEELRTLEQLAQQRAASGAKRQPKESADLESRLAAALAQPAGDARDRALRELAASLANSDAAAGRRIVERLVLNRSNQGIHEATIFLSAFAGAYAARQGEDAAAWAAGLPTEFRAQALNAVAGEWAVKQPDAALRWAQRIDEESTRASLLRSMASRLGQNASPDLVRTWSEQASRIPGAARAGDVIGRLWSQADPDAAARWAGSIPDAALQRAAVLGVLDGFGTTQPARAVAWVEGFPNSSLRNLALDEAIRLWARSEPRQAVQWVEAHSSPATQARLHPIIARAWSPADSQGLKSWVPSARLPADMKAYYLRR